MIFVVKILCLAYKEEQKGKKEAAASDKKRRQAEAMAQQSNDSEPMDQVCHFTFKLKLNIFMQTPAPSTSETPAVTTTPAND